MIQPSVAPVPAGADSPTAPRPELRLELLGGFRLWRGTAQGQTEVRLPSRPARRLLAYLGLRAGQPVTRTCLLALLWPDAPLERARRSLSQVLWLTRQALPELRGVLEADSERLCLHLDTGLRLDTGLDRRTGPAGLVVDAAQFRSLLAPALPSAPARLSTSTPLPGDQWSGDQLPGDQLPGDHALENRQAATALYRGELLPGWDDDWLTEERRALQALYLRTLEALTQAFGEQDTQAALEAALRWAAADPISEDAHRAVMRLAASLGRPTEAHAAYTRLSAALQAELGSLPDSETQALRERLGRSLSRPITDAAPAPGLLEAPLIGRERERARLLSVLDRSRPHQPYLDGSALLLEGEGGLGKTRLLRELVTDAQWRGTEVLWVQGSERAAAGPFGALRRALADALTPARATELSGRLEPIWLAAVAPLLSGLIPGLHGTDPVNAATLVPAGGLRTASLPRQVLVPTEEWLRGEWQRLREGLRRVLHALAASGPWLLIVDDLHWLDEGSLEVLRSLAERPVASLSLVLAYRPEAAREREEVWAVLQALDAAPGSGRLSLEPLSPQAATHLVRASLDLGGGLSALDLSVPGLSALAARLAHESGGHPLYLLETLRAVAESGALRRGGGVWRLEALPGAALPINAGLNSALPISAGLRSAVVGRLVRLARAPRALLEVAALMAEPAPPGVLLEAAGLGADSAPDLDLLVRRRWLERRSGTYAVAHDLLRGAVVAELATAVCVAHHARIAEVLRRRMHQNAAPYNPAVVARHFLAAGDWLRAAPLLLAAAQHARSLHDYRAVLVQLSLLLDDDLLRGALLPEQFAPEQLAQALELRWQANQVAGDLAAQARDLEALLAHSAPGSASALHLETRRAELMSKGAQVDRAQLEGAQGDGAQGEAGRTDGHGVEEALALAMWVRDQGLALGQRLAVAQALSSLRAILSAHGRYEEAVAHGAQAAALWRELGDDAACARALFSLGGDEMSLARPEAAAHLQEALAGFEALGDRLGLADALGSLAVIEDSRNQRARSRAYQLRALETHRATGSLVGAGRSLHNLAWMEADRNHLAQALKLYGEALELFVASGDRVREMYTRRSLTGLLVIQLGYWEAAQAQLEITDAYFERTGNARGQWFNLDARMYMAVQQGDYGAALSIAGRSRVLAAQAGDPPCELLSRWAAARLRTQRGDAASVEAFAALRPEIEALGMPGMTGEYDGQMGAALLRMGRAAEALDLIETSLHASQGEEQGGETEPRLMPELHHLRSRALEALGRLSESAAALDHAHRELSEVLDGLPERDLSLARVPEWRDLLRDWQERRLRRVRVALPACRGAAVSAAPGIDALLTLEAPEDLLLLSGATRRRARLSRLLLEARQQGAAPRVTDLARLLGCAAATIKRDLAALRRPPG